MVRYEGILGILLLWRSVILMLVFIISQVFVCLTHENSISNLYVGSQPPHSKESPRFSLSLERIVFYKPNVTWSQSWIRCAHGFKHC